MVRTWCAELPLTRSCQVPLVESTALDDAAPVAGVALAEIADLGVRVAATAHALVAAAECGDAVAQDWIPKRGHAYVLAGQAGLAVEM